MIKASFGGVGNISNVKDSIKYRVTSIKDLTVIIDHFDKYPLITQKRVDYELFKQAFYLISRKEHLTKEGLEKLIVLKASINRGLSDELKAAFPDIIPSSVKPLVDQEIKDPDWLAGFVILKKKGEGCFLISIFKDTTKTGFTVKLIFQIAQH